MRSALRAALLGLALAVGMAGISTDLAAAPPEGKGQKVHGQKQDRGPKPAANVRFQDQDRAVLRGFFADMERQGNCPPGLAKKQSRCMPPGQVRTWRVGAPLPPDVVIYDLPAALLAQLSPPPVDHRYVRVAGDILMIATGTSMVAAAIEDLAR